MYYCRYAFIGGFSTCTKPGYFRAPSRKDSALEKPAKTIRPSSRFLNPYLRGLPNLDDIITYRRIHQLYYTLEFVIDLHRRSCYNKVHLTSFRYLVSLSITTEVITHSISAYMKISNSKRSTVIFGFVAYTPNQFLAYPFNPCG
jgi:hypothetical protein